MQGRGRFESRQQELASISRSLKGLAKELNVPIVALSQLSRAPETRSDHRPQLSDLRESGALEQDADVVMFIYRAEQYRDRGRPGRTRKIRASAEIIIGKQRNGPTGTAKLAFIKEYTRFENLRARRRHDPSDGRARRSRRDPRQLPRHRRATWRLGGSPRARASSRSSRPTPTVTARRRSRCALEEAGAAMLACADIEEAIVLRQAGVRAPILVFGALSVSDLDGVFEHDLTPTISTPGRRARAAGGGGAARRRAALPPQDRHRHEPARVPPRQPRAHAAGSRRQPEPRDRRRLHAFRHRRRSRSRAVRASSARASRPLCTV